MTKRQLIEENTTLQEQVFSLKNEVEVLKKQRAALAKVTENFDELDAAIGGVLLALADNLKKSLGAKNIVNMKPDERDNLYYMLERLYQMERTSIKSKKGFIVIEPEG